MADYSLACKEIIDAVGGNDNIINVTHCATRLRLVLVDKSKYNAHTIDKIDGVQGLFYNSGQLQIIFGLNVPEVYRTFLNVASELGKDFSNVKVVAKKKQNIFMSILKTFPSIIMPILGMLVGCALITAFVNIVGTILQYSFGTNSAEWKAISTNIWYLMFKNVGGLVTSFLILFVCVSAAKLWKVNVFLATAVGLFLAVGPVLADTIDKTLIPGWAEFPGKLYGTIKPTDTLTNPTTIYSTSIFTGIVAIKFCSWIEHWLDKKVNDNWKMFVVCGTSLLFTILFSVLFFGPIMGQIEYALGWVSEKITDKSLYGIGLALLSLICAPLVITGVHQALIPIMLGNVAKQGWDILSLCMVASNIAQGAAAIAVAIKTKDQKMKSLGFSSGAIALLGITEPAMFGVNLRNKKAFFSAMVGAFCGGLFFGIMGAARIGFISPPSVLYLITAIPDASNPAFAEAGITYMNIVWLVIGMVITIVITMTMSLLWMSKKACTKETFISKKVNVMKTNLNVMHTNFMNSKFVHGYQDFKRNITFIYDKKAKMEYIYPTLDKLNKVNSPVEGEYIKLKDVNDPIFSSGTLGIGFAIRPNKGVIKAPFNGEVSMLFDTKHAIALTSNDGIELLIHIGIDTVKLEGKYFKSFVKAGSYVKEGDKLIEFNFKKIKKLGYDNSVICVITNKNENNKYEFVAENNSLENIKYNQ